MPICWWPCVCFFVHAREAIVFSSFGGLSGQFLQTDQFMLKARQKLASRYMSIEQDHFLISSVPWLWWTLRKVSLFFIFVTTRGKCRTNCHFVFARKIYAIKFCCKWGNNCSFSFTREEEIAHLPSSRNARNSLANKVTRAEKFKYRVTFIVETLTILASNRQITPFLPRNAECKS